MDEKKPPHSMQRPPINTSKDFQFGALFSRMDVNDKNLQAAEANRRVRDHYVDEQLSQIKIGLASIGQDVSRSLKAISDDFKKELDNQTETLKPLFAKNAILEFVEEQKAKQSELQTNFWVRMGAIVGIIVGGISIFGAVSYAIKVYVPPHVVMVQPMNEGSGANVK